MANCVRRHSEIKFATNWTRWERVDVSKYILAFASLVYWSNTHTHTQAPIVRLRRRTISANWCTKSTRLIHQRDSTERWTNEKFDFLHWKYIVWHFSVVAIYLNRTHFIYNFVSAVREMLFENVSVFIDRRCRVFNKIDYIRISMGFFRAISTVKQSAFGFWISCNASTIEVELNGTTENWLVSKIESNGHNRNTPRIDEWTYAMTGRDKTNAKRAPISKLSHSKREKLFPVHLISQTYRSLLHPLAHWAWSFFFSEKAVRMKDKLPMAS